MTVSPDYQAALDYIFNYVDYERRRSVPYTETVWDLARTRRVLHAMGDPHLALRYVHVAGSKGKGSTAANVDCDPPCVRPAHRLLHARLTCTPSASASASTAS